MRIVTVLPAFLLLYTAAPASAAAGPGAGSLSAFVGVSTASTKTNHLLEGGRQRTPRVQVLGSKIHDEETQLDLLSMESSSVSPSLHDRRKFLSTVGTTFLTSSTATLFLPTASNAEQDTTTNNNSIIVLPTGDVKKLFNEGRALEAQGNILAAQRLYAKVTKIAPNFIYGWSSLGNTLVAQGQLNDAEISYTKAINLCQENNSNYEKAINSNNNNNGGGFGGGGIRKCDDLYLLLLNRGSVRLNNQMPKEALIDLSKSESLRGRPDAIILQNLARAQELNGYYAASDKSYATAISMTANEVNPFWLRASMVKYQLGDASGAMDLLRRVENRFPEAPEVRAAYATLLWTKGSGSGGKEENEESARKKFLEIPDRQRLKYGEKEYVEGVVAWPPKMREGLDSLTRAVGDVQ